MPDLQTQQLMKQPPNNRIQKQMQDRSFLWCIQLISFHNACIIHGAMPLYMVLCHYTWCYAIIHGDMPFFRASEILKTKCQKAPSRNKAFRQSWEQVANSSVGTASNWKARTILTRVRVPGGTRDLSPSLPPRLSYGIRTAPVCNRMHQHLCAR